MAIQNLPEFAKNGQKNTDGLVLLDGFPVNKKPARQWMNFLFNQLTVAINAINAEKLDATTNAVSASKWQTARTINVSGSATGSVSIDGTKDVQLTLTLQNSGVVAGTYGSTIDTPVITVDAKGSIKVAKNQTIRNASTAQTGVVQLVDALNDSSVIKAPTANQVKILNDQAFGVDQDYIDVTAQRVNGTIYTVTGLKPKSLHITINSSPNANDDVLFVRKNTSSQWIAVGSRGSGSRTIYAVISPQYQYKYDSPTAFSKWVEA